MISSKIEILNASIDGCLIIEYTEGSPVFTIVVEDSAGTKAMMEFPVSYGKDVIKFFSKYVEPYQENG